MLKEKQYVYVYIWLFFVQMKAAMESTKYLFQKYIHCVNNAPFSFTFYIFYCC